MGLIIFIILGAFIGWLASRLVGREGGLLMYILIGIVGSFIGSFVSRMFTGSDNSFLAFDWGGLFWSLIGAIILVAILNLVSGHRHQSAS
jgi:uncharacterized membrane protein YeaQ/YmgE (transglycosylase-associated protein family)